MRIFSLIIFLSIFVNAAATAQQTVVASIRPLQLIAAAITDGITEPLLVMDRSQDPHHPSLRPSQRESMNRADIFLWIGPQLETGMERIVDELDTIVLTAIDTTGLTLYPINDKTDPHLWLDTNNVGIIAALLANTLSTVDEQNANRYQENLARFIAELNGIDEEIRGRLHAETFPFFAVYHNGYQYFEKQYSLSHIVSFTSNEEVQPGIRKIMKIKSALDDRKVNCIVVDSSVNTENLNNQLERENIRYISVDVLAHDISLASNGYFRFIRNLAEKFASCRG